MTVDEFAHLLKWALGSYQVQEMTAEETEILRAGGVVPQTEREVSSGTSPLSRYHQIEDLADDDEERDNIDDGENFAAAVLRAPASDDRKTTRCPNLCPT